MVLKEARAEGACRARWVGLPLGAKGVGQRSVRSRAPAWHEGKFLGPR